MPRATRTEVAARMSYQTEVVAIGPNLKHRRRPTGCRLGLGPAQCKCIPRDAARTSDKLVSARRTGQDNVSPPPNIQDQSESKWSGTNLDAPRPAVDAASLGLAVGTASHRACGRRWRPGHLPLEWLRQERTLESKATPQCPRSARRGARTKISGGQSAIPVPTIRGCRRSSPRYA